MLFAQQTAICRASCAAFAGTAPLCTNMSARHMILEIEKFPQEFLIQSLVHELLVRKNIPFDLKCILDP